MVIIVFDTNSGVHYYTLVIKGYWDRDTQAVGERRRVRRFPEELQRRAQRKLMMINNAADLNDLRVPPGNHLEALSGDRDGQNSIRINDQWRICFAWDDGDAYEVEIVDYQLPGTILEVSPAANVIIIRGGVPPSLRGQ